jgi:hypothetical protein
MSEGLWIGGALATVGGWDFPPPQPVTRATHDTVHRNKSLGSI